MPNPFGQSADYSGVFASLGREQISAIATATRSAANQASTDQNAADQEAQSKWKAGQISDAQWLDYIRQRLAAASGDPEEQQRWADALRVNESAIEDAQFETKFQLGKITAQALLSHYNQRMGSVEENSPAYRDLASRYQQVIDYIKGGAGRGSGGGGGGGGGSASKFVADEAKGNTPGGSTSASGYDQSGPDVVTSATAIFGVGNLKYHADSLLANQRRIRAMMDQYKRNTNLRELVDPLGGPPVPVTPELLHGLDNQYLRNQDSLASVYAAMGDQKKYTDALSDKTDYVSSVMVDHNTDRIEAAYTEFQKGQVALYKEASGLPPDQAITLYRQAAKNTTNFIDGAFGGEGGVGLRQFLGKRTGVEQKANRAIGIGNQPENLTAELPPEMASSGALWDVMQGWSHLGKIGVDPNLSDEDSRYLADEAIRLIAGQIEPTTAAATRGERSRLISKDISDLIDGDPLDPAHTASEQSTFGPSHRGIFATIIQREGLNNVDPSYDGPRFVYQVNPDGSHQVARADAAPDATGSRLLLSPSGQDHSAQIQVAIKLGGQTVLAFAKPTQIPVNLLPAGMAAYASDGSIQVPDDKGGTKTLAAGALLSSDFIKKQESAHPGWFQGLVRTGAIVKTSPAWGVIIDTPGSTKPVIWFQDAKSGTLSLTPPHLDTNQIDTVTKGVSVGADGRPAFNDVPFSGGSVVAFGAGFTNGEMRNFIRSQVMSGGLDLNDFKTRGAGTSIGGPPTLDDVLEAFKSTPAELHQGPHGRVWGQEHDDLQNGLEQQRKDKSKAWLAENMPGAENSPVAVSGISQIAGFLGIKISGDDPTTPNNSKATQRQDASVSARNDALAASKSRQLLRTGPGGFQGLSAKVNLTPLPVQHALLTPNPAPVIGPHPLVKPTPLMVQPPKASAQAIQSGRYKGKRLGGL